MIGKGRRGGKVKRGGRGKERYRGKKSEHLRQQMDDLIGREVGEE